MEAVETQGKGSVLPAELLRPGHQAVGRCGGRDAQRRRPAPVRGGVSARAPRPRPQQLLRETRRRGGALRGPPGQRLPHRRAPVARPVIEKPARRNVRAAALMRMQAEAQRPGLVGRTPAVGGGGRARRALRLRREPLRVRAAGGGRPPRPGLHCDPVPEVKHGTSMGLAAAHASKGGGGGGGGASQGRPPLWPGWWCPPWSGKSTVKCWSAASMAASWLRGVHPRMVHPD